MLECKNIFKNYENLHILKGVDLVVEKSKFCAIVGPSGAGKSTLLHIAGTLDKADQGTITINNTDISTLNEKELALFRNKHIGFVFQFHYLLPEFNALENVCMPKWIGGDKKSDHKAKELLDFLGLKDRLYAMPNTLSGGEQQRVAIARALINEPYLLFADEPTGNLDSERANELHQLFLQMKNTFQTTIVVVTHNEALANIADTKIMMKDGNIV